MKKRYAIPLILFSAIAVWAFWATRDETPADYSDMDVVLGTTDPAINGYTLLRQAEDADFKHGRLEESDDGNYDNIDPFYPEDTPLSADEIRGILAANRQDIELFKMAFSREQFRYDHPLTAEFVPETGRIQAYFKLRVLEARLAALEGRPDDALRQLIEVSREVAVLLHSGGPIVSHLNAAFCLSLCNDEIQHLVLHYDLEASTLRDALRDYPVRGLMQETAAEALRFEFQFTRNETADLEKVSVLFLDPPANDLVFLLKPNALLNDTHTEYNRVIAELEKPATIRKLNYREAVKNLSPMASIFRGDYINDSITMLLWPAVGGVFRDTVKVDLGSEATYLMLAMKLYYNIHGELPPTLDALVPQYIPAVPVDPYDGKSIRYQSDRARFYSVGTDGADAGGSAFVSRLDRDALTNEDISYPLETAEHDDEEPTYHLRFDAALRANIDATKTPL